MVAYRHSLSLEGCHRFASVHDRRYAIVCKNVRENLPENVIRSQIPKNTTWRIMRHDTIMHINVLITHFLRIGAAFVADVLDMKTLGPHSISKINFALYTNKYLGACFPEDLRDIR
jgi:hypothetical protein